MPAKALSSYEREVRVHQYSLRKAVQSLRERPHRRDHCTHAGDAHDDAAQGAAVEADQHA